MDVRCDRCQTEYELEDGSVTEAETSVQCTSCGHTFVVTRDGSTLAGVSSPRLAGTPPSGLPGSAEPSAADWLLATEDGQTHRFRDLTTLHKWIVERKVTAHDRVSQKGGPWRRLSELPELEPFLAVVAQADRARAAQPGGEPTGPGQGSPPPVPGSPGHSAAPAGRSAPRAASVDDVDDEGDIYTSARYQRPQLTSAPPLFDPQITPEEDYEPISFAPSHRGAKIVAGVMIVGLAVVAAYAGFKQPHWLPLFKRAEQATTEPAVSAPPAPQPVAAPAAPAAPAPVTVAPPPSPSPDPAPVQEAPAPTAVAEPAPAPAPAAAPPPAPAPRAGDGDALANTKGKSYERLVSDADRLLENGHTSKAQKLYDQALVLQPNGVAAVTGSAFLLLDRQKSLAAISMFKRALGRAPGYPPALFGLGEAYRAQGEFAQAIAHYKQYLAVAPTGPDAHAARGQIRELEAAPSRRAQAPPPSGVIPPSPSAVIPTEERFIPAPAAPP